MSKRGQIHKCSDEDTCTNWAFCPVADLEKRKNHHLKAKDEINKIL